MSGAANCEQCGAEVLDIDLRCKACGANLATTGAKRMVGQVVLSEYEVKDVLGQGGMAIVYRGRHRVTGQEVALKVLPPEMAAHRDIQSRFVQEARALAQLDHPNIVHLYNFGQDNGCFVLAMQLADGPTWERLILEAEDGLDWRRSVKIALQVTDALDYAHEHGIVHRDMKPSNVSVRESDGLAMVMDFGIAKDASDSRLTATGQTMGTVRYMSPEQVRGKTVTRQTDIYSLAMTLYEAIAGDTPFDGETQFDIMSKHLKELPKPLSSIKPSVPQALSEVVAWGMAKKADDRPADARTFGRALREVLEGGSPMIPRAAAVAAPIVLDSAAGRRPPWALVAALVLAAAAGGLFYNQFVRGGSAQTPPTASDSGARLGTGSASTPAASADAAPPEIPDGVVIESEQDFPEDRLRLLLAPGVDGAGLREVYRQSVASWRRFLSRRGLSSRPEFAREMPRVVLLVGPAELFCERSNYKSEGAWKECLQFGAYQRAARMILVPSNRNYLELAIKSNVPVVFCDMTSSDRCYTEAEAYQLEIFSGN